MSRRKRHRKLRNREVKNNLRLMAKTRQKKRNEEEAREEKEDLRRACEMFEVFKSELCSEQRTGPQIIADFEAFRDVIKKVVKSKYVVSVVMDLIDKQEAKFIAAYGPKSEAQKAAWHAEAKKLRKPPEEPVKPENN